MKPVYKSLPLQTGILNTGIYTVHVAPREWLAYNIAIDFSTGKVTREATLLPGKNWLLLEFAPQSYDFDEKEKTNKSGSYYDISIVGDLNKYDAAVHQVLETIRYHELVAIVTNRNRLKQIVGNMEAGLRRTFNSKKLNNSYGHEDLHIELRMEAEDPSPFYDPIVYACPLISGINIADLYAISFKISSVEFGSPIDASTLRGTFSYWPTENPAAEGYPKTLADVSFKLNGDLATGPAQLTTETATAYTLKLELNCGRIHTQTFVTL